MIWYKLASILLCLAASLVLFGCASTTVSDREQLVFGELPQPGNILVYDFAASADELPPNSTLYGNSELDTTPQTALGLAALIGTHNPAGLIISGGIHAYGEVTGSSKVEGRAKQTAKEISEVLKKRFQEQGWI